MTRWGRWLGRCATAGMCAALVLIPRTAPATIEEQRARLPPPAECQDPVEGVWLSLSWYEHHVEWYEFTLEVHRDPQDQTKLNGQILVDFWRGIPEESEPQQCRGLRVKLHQPAVGTFVDGVITFGGTSYQLDQDVCGVGWDGNYYVDTFSGPVEETLHEFQTINNWDDNGVHYAYPTLFRRIKCFDEPQVKTPTNLEPPPFYPKRKRATGGC